MALQGKTEEKEFGGETFIFQHPGIEGALDIQERSKDEGGKRVDKEYFKELLEHVVFVKDGEMPKKINLSYFEKFDSMSVFAEVVRHASKFLFR